MPIRRYRSACWTAGILLGLLAACGGGGGTTPAPAPGAGSPPAAPPLSSALNDATCALQYALTDTPLLTGVDPILAQQWHLNNDGTVTGSTGEDVRAFAAWSRTKGEGVRVAVIDDAIEVTHRDLLPNVVPGASYNYRQTGRGNAYPLPCSAADNHGTSVTGLIVARDGNGLGVAGVAPLASLVGYNALATSSDADVNEALNRDLAANSIYNNSWGSPDDGFLHPAEPSFIEAIERGIADGRAGKGAIYVFPAGNGGCYNPDLAATPTVEPCVRENSNYDGYVNKLGVITVCAVSSEGRQPFYGERGANMLVCAPSSNLADDASVRTTAIQDDYRDDFTGTSASTPMVSGVVAMMLAANPNLTWRDVRLILAQSARKNHETDPDWRSSAFGPDFSHKYGFGVADADAAVQLAQGWASVGGSASLQKCGPYAQAVDQLMPDPASGTTTPVASTIAVAGCGIARIEFIEVRFTAKNANFPVQTTEHPSTGDLRIRLTSPQGLVSELADQHLCYNASEQAVSCGAYNDFAFGSVRHLEEPVIAGGNGNWTLEATDMLSQDQGKFVGWSVTFHGR